jgi:hypothetical protein
MEPTRLTLAALFNLCSPTKSAEILKTGIILDLYKYKNIKMSIFEGQCLKDHIERTKTFKKILPDQSY